MEHKIIASIVRSRGAWERLRDAIDPSSEFSSETADIFNRVSGYYNNDPNAQQVDVELLCDQIKRSVPSVKLAERIQKTLRELPPDVSDLNIVKELLSLRVTNLGYELAGLLGAGRAPHEEIAKKMAEYIRLQGKADLGDESNDDERELQKLDIKDLVGSSFNKDSLIKLYPKILNEACDGGAKPGHHIVVFAPTEMGKTLFVINLVYGFIYQGLRVLYIGNEDPAADIYMRFVTRLTELRKETILAHPEKAQEILNKRRYENFILAPLAPGNFAQINRLVDKHDPQVVILDQLRNLDVRSEGRTQQLERAATEARNLAKSRNVLVVSVTQAGDSATGKTVLGRGDIDGSNVGIPGQADLMIGIGADAQMEMRNGRMLSFPKNKLSGKHDPILISIDPSLSRILE